MIDALGMEAAHGRTDREGGPWITGLLPNALAARMMEHASVGPRLNALYGAIDAVRRGGTISLAAFMAARLIHCRC